MADQTDDRGLRHGGRETGSQHLFVATDIEYGREEAQRTVQLAAIVAPVVAGRCIQAHNLQTLGGIGKGHSRKCRDHWDGRE